MSLEVGSHLWKELGTEIRFRDLKDKHCREFSVLVYNNFIFSSCASLCSFLKTSIFTNLSLFPASLRSFLFLICLVLEQKQWIRCSVVGIAHLLTSSSKTGEQCRLEAVGQTILLLMVLTGSLDDA